VTQLLDLSALERDTIKLADGAVVELRNPDEFAIVDDYRLRTLITELVGVDLLAFKSEEDAAEASAKLHTLAAMLTVSLPEGSDDFACAAIFDVWVKKHLVVVDDKKGDAGPPKSRRTTAASSQGSKRSTAATRKTGSKPSRGGR
jgi:hypothetical protein